MTHVKVYPTKASALNVRHPDGAIARSDGADWPYDAFTCGRLADGSFTDDPKKAFRPLTGSPAGAPVSATVADGSKKQSI